MVSESLGEFYAPGVAWDGGRVHALGLAEASEEWEGAGRAWQLRHKQGKVCPVCLDPIHDDARTCIHCIHEWRKILADPKRLAEWVVMASEEPALQGGWVRVWERAG